MMAMGTHGSGGFSYHWEVGLGQILYPQVLLVGQILYLTGLRAQVLFC
jgi:hypothetical protein